MTEVEAKQASAIVKLIANSERIRLIQAMLDGEVRVGTLAVLAGISQSATSQHLTKLKNAGMVVQRQDRQSRYTAITPKWVDCIKQLILIAEEHALSGADGSP